MNALIFGALVTLSVAAAIPHGELGYAFILNGGQGHSADVGGPHTGAAQLTGPNAGPVNIVGPSVGAISIIGPSFNAGESVAAIIEGPAEIPFKDTHGYGW